MEIVECLIVLEIKKIQIKYTIIAEDIFFTCFKDFPVICCIMEELNKYFNTELDENLFYHRLMLQTYRILTVKIKSLSRIRARHLLHIVSLRTNRRHCW